MNKVDLNVNMQCNFFFVWWGVTQCIFVDFGCVLCASLCFLHLSLTMEMWIYNEIPKRHPKARGIKPYLICVSVADWLKMFAMNQLKPGTCYMFHFVVGGGDGGGGVGFANILCIVPCLNRTNSYICDE